LAKLQITEDSQGGTTSREGSEVTEIPDTDALPLKRKPLKPLVPASCVPSKKRKLVAAVPLASIEAPQTSVAVGTVSTTVSQAKGVGRPSVESEHVPEQEQDALAVDQTPQAPSSAGEFHPRGVLGAATSLTMFEMPLLLSNSLFHLLSHPDQSLVKTWSTLQASLTFSMEFFIQGVRSARTRTAGARDQALPLHGALVHWSQDGSAFAEASTFAMALQNEAQRQKGLLDGRIIFLDWGRLKLSDENNSSDTIRWQDMVIGYLRCTEWKVRQFTYGVEAWHEALRNF